MTSREIQKNMEDPIYVTRPYLPPLEKFVPYLEKIWQSHVLTNNGPLHQNFEKKLGEYLGVDHISLFNNGTIALLTAIQALDLKGEVITTPYSFVATAHSLLWNDIKPVFVDINPKTFNIDPEKIEAAITSETTAILPVHCYGHVCDVKAIQNIANKNKLKVVYDAAHAFGVKDCRGSILRYGNLSVLSLHATKVFNTFEGGAIVSPDAETKKRIDHLRNFGFVDETTVVESGINGKMSEINAAMGLLQLEYIDDLIRDRKNIDEKYRRFLSGVKGIEIPSDVQNRGNFSYFPILVTDDYPLSRDGLYEEFKKRRIFVRRYFYPLISDFPMYKNILSASKQFLPIARRVSSQVICLPIYPEMQESDINRVIEVILNFEDKKSYINKIFHI